MSQAWSRSQPLSQEDNVVVLMGPTGSGKSTLINCATRQNDPLVVGHGLRSCTSEINAVRIRHPRNGRSVVLVDTPGFDDTTKNDTDIISMIANWLVKACEGKMNLATIIYLHKISDNRMTGSLLKYLQMFSSICGQDAMPCVIIVTTMWGKVDKDEGEQREGELNGDFWKDILGHGCETARFDKTYDCAWRIIGSLDQQERGKLPSFAPKKLDSHMRRSRTISGITLNKELEKLLNDQTSVTRKLEQQQQDHELKMQQLNELKAEIDQKIREVSKQLRKSKIPYRRKVLRLFKASKRGKRHY